MKLTTIPLLGTFTYNNCDFIVKEKQKESILVLRISDNHLFNLTGDTDVQSGSL